MAQVTVTRLPRSAGMARWRGLFAWCSTVLERRRQRRALADLDDHLLRDIGLTREQALIEAAQPPWR